MVTPVFRFAPSPNGYLHLGHALSALINFDVARAVGGRFLIRIEDIDRSRCRAEFEEAIYEDLAWLGLTWEEPVRRQSEHFDDYRAALANLVAQGLIYPAFESRGEIARLVAAREVQTPWPRDPDGASLYPGTAKALSAAEREQRMAAGEPYALRLDMAAALALISARARESGDPEPQKMVAQQIDLDSRLRGNERSKVLYWSETGSGPAGETGQVQADPAAWGDVIVARKETPTSYHLSVVIDDAQQGVSHVVRGQDLFWSTSAHRLLQALLDLPAPVYRHHRLILDADGRKLSKSTRATALRALREDGASATDIRRMVGVTVDGLT